MRQVGIFIILAVLNLFAFTNLTFTPDTIQMEEITVMKGDFSAPGDSADIFIYLDVNENGAYEENTDLVTYSSVETGDKFIDGKYPMDTVADGKTEIHLPAGGDGPFPFPGLNTMIVGDRGGSDTASVYVKTWPQTNTKISGKVRGPAGGGLPNVLVFADVSLAFRTKGENTNAMNTRKILFNTKRKGDINRNARTDAKGDYLIYLPDSLKGRDVLIGAVDAFGLLKDSSFLPPPGIDTTVAANLAEINFQFTKATQFIAGTVRDEQGNSILKARLELEEREQDIFVDVKVDSGKFIAPVVAGSWEVWFEETEGPKKYMMPNVKIDVLESDDTVKIDYVLYTTNSTIKGVVYDSAGINLDDYFSTHVSVDTTGTWIWDKGVWYSSNAEILDDTSFSVAVNSKFLRYTLDTWVDEEALPLGYFVTPSKIDSVGPGQSDIVIKIQKGDKFIDLTVIDENSNFIANTDITVCEIYSDIEVMGQTNANGVALLQVSTGDWNMFLEDNSYMNHDTTIKVEQSDDTVHVTYMVHSTDAAIEGTVTGDIAGLKEIFVLASSNHDSLNKPFYAEAEVTTRGDFILNVSSSSHFAGYHVEVDRWDLPMDYVAVPQWIDGVAPGTDTLKFEILAPKGTISGKITMTFPTQYQASVTAIDTARDFLVNAPMKNDSTYLMKLPNGVYTVVGGYVSPTDTLLYSVDSIVVNNNDIIINFTDSGAQIVPVVFTPVTDYMVFNLKSFPNPFRGYTTISFSIPFKGKASLNIYDLNGRTLMTLYSGYVNKGRYTFALNTDKLGYQIKSGYLIARLSIRGEKRYTKNIRLIHLK